MKTDLAFYHEHDLSPWLALIGQWRLKEFSSFPYLYDGTLKDEERFSIAWAKTPGSSLVVATGAEGELAGLCTGSPLNSDLEAFTQKGYTPAQWYYLGEVIVAPAYRGQGLAGQLMERMEYEASRMGYAHFCLLCVRRSIDHPLRPAGYEGPDSVWERRGYHKLGIETNFKWRAFGVDGGSSEQEHVMEYWGK